MTRRTPAYLVTILTLIALAGAAGTVRADSSTPPAAPSSLSMTSASTGKTVPVGGWINRGRIILRFTVQVAGGPLTPQVEIEPVTTAFNGKPNFTGPSLSSSGLATVTVTGLLDRGLYHWQARTVDASGAASAWTTFAATSSSVPDVGVDEDPPSRPVITSPDDPDQNKWYNTAEPTVQWKSHDALSGVLGYTYQLERQAHVIPPGAIVDGTAAKLTNLTDGVWFLALRAVDRAGNWSPTATFRLQLDRTLPRLTWIGPTRFTFNPYRSPATIHLRANKDSSVRLALYRVGSSRPTATYAFPSARAGQILTVVWNGKNSHGKPVRKGYYFLSGNAVDRANNVGHFTLGGIIVQPERSIRAVTGQILYPGDGKRIIVSLSRQTLYAYDGARLVLTTYVTTGNPALPTPLGSYTIMAKDHPFEFISPWPAGSPFWYPPSWTTYAMLFRDGGYFLHDAPWRSNFGPGSNAQTGTPGGNYTGTHGCVNIPMGAMTFLWNWSPIGTAVDIVP